MKDYIAKKTVGFYLTVAATILAIVALVFYGGVSGKTPIVSYLIYGIIAVELVLIVGSLVLGNKPFFSLAALINAVLTAAALVQSFNPQLDNIGFVVSGLYGIEQIVNFVIFVGFIFVAWLLFIAASFMKLDN